MQCNIKYALKARNGKKKYWCTIHKAKANDKDGNILEECLSENKESYNKSITLQKDDIKSIKIEFENLNNSTDYIIYINDKVLEGVLMINNSSLEKTDFLGLFLSIINDIELEEVRCNHCKHPHNDNNLFAITPHRKHMCQYCGREFFCKKANVGSELISYIKIPKIKYIEKKEEINGKFNLLYDVLEGKIYINNECSSKKIIINEKEELAIYINKLFKLL